MPTNSNIDCDKWLQALNSSPSPAVGIVWDTFGTDYSCVTKFLDQNKHRSHAVRVHLSNESWRDQHAEGFEGDLFLGLNPRQLSELIERRDPQTLQVFKQRIKDIKDFLDSNKNENTVTILSTGLEDVYSDRAYSTIREFLLAERFDYVVRNPLFADGYDDREGHGTAVRCNKHTIIASEDGGVPNVDTSRAFLRRNRGCLVTFLWRAAHQGRSPHDGGDPSSYSPPRERAFEFEDGEEMEALLMGSE